MLRFTTCWRVLRARTLDSTGDTPKPHRFGRIPMIPVKWRLAKPCGALPIQLNMGCQRHSGDVGTSPGRESFTHTSTFQYPRASLNHREGCTGFESRVRGGVAAWLTVALMERSGCLGHVFLLLSVGRGGRSSFAAWWVPRARALPFSHIWRGSRIFDITGGAHECL